jgi:hypothetical protein
MNPHFPHSTISETVEEMDEPAKDSEIDEPVAVYSTPNLAEAEIAKNALTAEGIRCGLVGETQGGFTGLFAVQVNYATIGDTDWQTIDAAPLDSPNVMATFLVKTIRRWARRPARARWAGPED